MNVIQSLYKADTRPAKAEPIREELPFTLADIRAAIPAHLFKAHIPTSWYYILRDLSQFALTAYIAYLALSVTENTYLRAAIWILHAFVQGTTGFGLWVIGHECGHQAYFGDGHWLNDPVGFVIHSGFCDPYHSWRITHATHHKFTNSRELDTAFPAKDYPTLFHELGESFPPIHLFLMAVYFFFGWPFYINANYEGHRYATIQNHWNPNAPMFQKKDRNDIIMSGVGVLVMLGLLASFATTYGWSNVFLWYGLPWMATHSWLVVVTFLQHSDPRVPHYDEADNFNFVKGAISTVDRDYSAILNNMMHHITDAHLVHHLFSRMAFYNAKQATPYVAKFLGKHYVYDNRNLFQQFVDAWFSHQASFYHSKAWQAANPGKNENNWPSPRKARRSTK